MRALVYTGPGVMAVEDRPPPTPGPADALITVAAAGICGSDLHGYSGASGRRTPGVVMGHEVAGTVDGLGAGGDADLLGCPVVIFPLLSCGTCEACRTGSEQLCAERSYIGIGRDGGFAEQAVVPQDNIVPTPGDLDPAVATLTEPAAVALHALARAPDLTGASVLVTGAGPIGILLARAAMSVGKAARVVNSEVSPARRAAAIRIGLEVADPRTAEWLERLGPGSAGPFDVVFEAVGIQPTFDAALDAVRARGCIVLVAGWQTVSLSLGRVVTKEVETRGTFNFGRQEFEAALSFLSSFDAAALITDRVRLADGPAVFSRLSADQGASVKTVIIP